jgi:glutamate-1-semialdehyde 2,1-aminomutase
MQEINQIGSRNNVPVVAKGFGGRTVIHFGASELNDNYEDVVHTWNKDYHFKCYHKAYEKGLFAFLMPLTICPEPITITPAHDRSDIDKALNIFEIIIKTTNYR